MPKKQPLAPFNMSARLLGMLNAEYHAGRVDGMIVIYTVPGEAGEYNVAFTDNLNQVEIMGLLEIAKADCLCGEVG